MSEIPILIVCDAANTVKNVGKGGTLANPRSLGSQQSSCIFMITENSYLVNNQAGAELEVKVHSGDIIMWRATTVTKGNDYNIILVKYTSDSPTYVEDPEMKNVTLDLWEPADVKNPDGSMKEVNYPDYELQATVLLPNHRVTYHWTFKLVDRDGNVLGYYNWDPYIKIS